jgi:hypothetical protein
MLPSTEAKAYTYCPEDLKSGALGTLIINKLREGIKVSKSRLFFIRIL